MESPRDQALNPQQKAQLKEKLVLLKREYRRTFHRLQRAERAERVKTYVKRTVAEQNLLLHQEGNEEDRSGSATGAGALVALVGTSPTKPVSVSFRPDPEVFAPEDTCLPLTPASKSTKQNCRKVLFGPEKKGASLSRGRTRAQRRITLPLEKRAIPAPEALWRDEGSQQEQKAAWAGLVGSQSPVFERRRSNSIWEAVPKWSMTATDGSSCESTPLLLRPECAQETIFPGDSQPRPSSPSCNSHVPSIDCTKDSAGEKTLPQEDCIVKEEEPMEVGHTQSEEDPALWRSTDSMERHGTQEEGRSDLEAQAPTKTLQEKALEGPLDLDSPLQEGKMPPTELSSCTVVEGLLFPVEYYVRTTRRMSSRQREVNVEAVIQSQLGRSKKGQKASRKTVLSSQKAAEIPRQLELLPFSSPAASPSDGGLTEGHLQTRRKGRPRKRDRWLTPSAPSQDSERAGASFISRECQGEEGGGPDESKATESPVSTGGHLGARRKGPGEGRGQEAEFQTPLDLPGAPEAEPGPGLLPWKERETLPEGSGQLPESPIGLGLASSILPFHSQSGEATLLQWLPPSIPALQDFCLPEDEFGLLKSEKIKTCAAVVEVKGLAAEVKGSTPGEHLADPAIIATPEVSAASPLAPHLAPRCLSSDLLLSPALEASSGPLLSPLPSPAFPFLGATPASPPFPTSQAFSASPLQGKPGTEREASPSFPQSGTKRQRKASWPAEEEVASLQERQLPAGASPEDLKQNEGLEQSPEEVAPEEMPGEGCLQMTSRLKTCAGPSSSFVDVSTVWWEVDSFTVLCVVTASEGSVSLWRPLDAGHWAPIHTWHFTKVPVIQIVPLPGVRSLVCVALGNLEIVEIRFLFHPAEGSSIKQSVVKAGNIKAVLGLRKRRMVTSCGSVGEQEVEVASFSEMGRSIGKRALKPPEEPLLAFAEVDGMEEALVGMTTMNSLVIWNLTSGQLLRKMSISCSFPASICHRAYADAGLLFVVLSHPHAKERQTERGPAFCVVALNPKTGRSATVTAVSLPRGSGGRFLEGEVKDASAAAAVLTSGAIAVWDLLLGCCTALLAPGPEGKWSLVRWSPADGSLLAGKEDGSLCLYSNSLGLPPT
ncbi:partner and localizer of BRCA2 isoform X1 [Anolis sagrei]|uniref:partner and localizer of BRCA2 isoform X1 n=1 Tax=Anolis sagrei TaxID=38937 RepID=UPI003520D6B5